MRPWLGIAVSQRELRAVVTIRARILWAGSAPYDGEADLADVLARLAAEASPRPTRARVVLERDVVQLRTIAPAPPLRRDGLRRNVALDAPRLFRNGQGPLVTDALRVRSGPRETVLLAAAASEALSRGIVAGCEQAGIRLASLGPAAEILPRAGMDSRDCHTLPMPTASGAEYLDLWAGDTIRSRRRAEAPPEPAWVPPLAALGPDAWRFAGAFAATRGPGHLQLLPADWHRRRAARAGRRLWFLAAAAALAWALAGGTIMARASLAERAAAAESARLRGAVEGARSVRRDLGDTRAALNAVRRARANRSRLMALLAALTGALGDSASLASLHLGRDSTLHLGGFAPSADAVIAALERVPGLAAARFEAPNARQSVAVPGARPRELDRFAIAVRLRGWP